MALVLFGRKNKQTNKQTNKQKRKTRLQLLIDLNGKCFSSSIPTLLVLEITVHDKYHKYNCMPEMKTPVSTNPKLHAMQMTPCNRKVL